ncbi:MAG TPA: hypothetical protein DCF63_00430 [Planctomycetaceae bacterium]|nr:hypothetical protein [Planctomycetaceae bacterium]
MLHPLITIITTVGTAQQASQVAKALLDARLAACVQIDGPLRSLYRWQGKSCDETEYRLNCKTLPGLRENVIQLIRSCHPYELPEVLVVAGESLHDYAKWVAEQVAQEAE